MLPAVMLGLSATWPIIQKVCSRCGDKQHHDGSMSMLLAQSLKSFSHGRRFKARQYFLAFKVLVASILR